MVDRIGDGDVPEFSGKSSSGGLYNTATSNGFEARTSGDASSLTFEVNQRLQDDGQGEDATFAGFTADALYEPAFASGISLTTAGTHSPIVVTLSNVGATGGTVGENEATARGIGVSSAGSYSTIDFVAEASEFAGGLVSSLSTSQAAYLSGIFLETAGEGAAIEAYLTSVSAIGGGTMGLVGYAHGFSATTTGDNADVDVTLTDVSLISGDNYNILGLTNGANLATVGEDSDISFDLVSGSIVTQAVVSTAHGIYLFASGEGADIDAYVNATVTALSSSRSIGLLAETGSGDITVEISAASVLDANSAGVLATTAGDGNISITLEGSAMQSAALSGSIDLASIVPVGLGGIASGDGNVTIAASADSVVTQMGAIDDGTSTIDGVGILAIAEGAGNAAVIANGSVNTTGIGVAAVAMGGGAATVSIAGTVTHGGGTGSSPIATLGFSTYFDFADLTVDVLAQSDAGAAALMIDGGVVGGSADIGALAAVQGGTEDATLHVISSADGQASIEANLIGIAGINLGAGNVSITETGHEDGASTVHGSIQSGGIGVLGFAREGDVSISAGEVTAGTREITVDVLDLAGGIVGVSLDGSVNIESLGTITAAGSDYGIHALSYAGDATATIGADIWLPNIGVQAVAVTEGTISVEVHDDVWVYAQTAGITGIHQGIGDIEIVIGDGAVVFGSLDGIFTSHNGDGDTSFEIGTGAVIYNPSGAAIWAEATANSNSLTIDNAGLMQGAAAYIIRAQAVGEISITNQATGGIQSTDASPAATAILAFSDSRIGLVNEGFITGKAQLYSVGVDADGVSILVENNGSSSWNWEGASNFYGLGDLYFSNGEEALIELGSAAYADFYTASGNIEIINAGTLNFADDNSFIFDSANGTNRFANIGELNITGSTSFTGLQEFDNSGTISMANGANGDLLYIPGDFHASGGSALAIDVDLTPGGTADTLYLGGSLSGTTLVTFQDIGTGLAGELDADDAIVFALVDGDTDVTNFITAGGIKKGGHRYDAYLRETPQNMMGMDEWVLASAPSAEAMEVMALVHGMQNMWHASAGPWLDRAAGLHNRSAGAGAPLSYLPTNETLLPAASADATHGWWGRIHGGTLGIDVAGYASSPDGLIGTGQAYEDRLRLDHVGFTAGVDFGEAGISASGRDKAWSVGAMAGYAVARLGLESEGANASLHQGTIGLYAGWLHGGWFVDAALKGDFGTLTNPLADGGDGSANYHSLGAMLTTGYRVERSNGWFLEPKATFSYALTRLDDQELTSASISMDDSVSLQGRLGLRVGTTIARDIGFFEPWFEASAWNEFDGRYNATVTSSSSELQIHQVTKGWSGEIAAGMRFISLSAGWNAVGRGSFKFGVDDRIGFGGQIELRRAW